MAELKLVAPITTRTCEVCGKEKPIGEWINRATKRIKYAGCRKCRDNAYTKQRRAIRNGLLKESGEPTLNSRRANRRREQMGEQRWREYTRDVWLRTTHKITSADYARMLIAQNGVCAICRRPEIATHQMGRLKGTAFQLAVDHCHRTGKIRGLLCRKCNQGLGHYEDEPIYLRAAADYLEKTR